MSFNKTVKAEYVQMLLLVAGTDDLLNAVIEFYMCLTCGRLANVDPFDAVDFLENVAKYGKNARKETVDSAMHRRLRVYTGTRFKLNVFVQRGGNKSSGETH